MSQITDRAPERVVPSPSLGLQCPTCGHPVEVVDSAGVLEPCMHEVDLQGLAADLGRA